MSGHLWSSVVKVVYRCVAMCPLRYLYLDGWGIDVFKGADIRLENIF